MALLTRFRISVEPVPRNALPFDFMVTNCAPSFGSAWFIGFRSLLAAHNASSQTWNARDELSDWDFQMNLKRPGVDVGIRDMTKVVREISVAPGDGDDCNEIVRQEQFPDLIHAEIGKESKPTGYGRHNSIAKALAIDILSGRFAPDEPLTGEIEASQHLDLSRSAYREALRTLAAKGLVRSRKKAGTRVTDRYLWSVLDQDILSWMFDVPPDPSFIEDLLELRLMIEPAAAALAASRRTDEGLNHLRQCLTIMETVPSGSAERQSADIDFHDEILRSTKNEAVASLSCAISATISWIEYFAKRAQASRYDTLHDHRTILEAVTKGDPEKAKWATEVLVRRTMYEVQECIANKAKPRVYRPKQ